MRAKFPVLSAGHLNCVWLRAEAVPTDTLWTAEEA
jgi:hypothetical protein